MATRKHTSYSITSVILLILGIVGGGFLISVQKTSEVLIPFESSGSGELLSSPMGASPEGVPISGLENTLASNISKRTPAQWYGDHKTKIRARYAVDIAGADRNQNSVEWTGRTVCNGQPLSGVYIEDSVTNESGAFAISVTDATAFYHPSYGVVTRARPYHSFTGDVEFCNTTPANSEVDAKYFINPDNLQLKLSARVFDKDTSPAIGWEDEYVYLQCWTWSGKWDLRLNEWRHINEGSADMISLFPMERGKRNYFICRTYTYDQGQYAGPEWISNGGANPIQSYVASASVTKLAESIDSCKNVRSRGTKEELPAILQTEQIDSSILNYCEEEYPLLWQLGMATDYPRTETGCGEHNAHMANVVNPLLNQLQVPYAERSSSVEEQLGIPRDYGGFCSAQYSYMAAGPLYTPEPTEGICRNLYFDLYENTYSESKEADESLLVKKNYHYNPAIIGQCVSVFPDKWKPYVTPSSLLCTQVKAYDKLEILDVNLPRLGVSSWGKQHISNMCKKSFPDIMYEMSDFTYTENQCHLLAEWWYMNTLESEMTARGYKGEKQSVCKELYPALFDSTYLFKVMNFRNTGVIETDHIRMSLMPENRTKLQYPGKFVDNMEKLYLAYADMVGGKPFGAKKIPVEERCPYKGEEFVNVKTVECPAGTMTYGWKICSGVEANNTCSTGYTYNQAWGLASGLNGDGTVAPTQIITSGMKDTVTKFNTSPQVMSFGLAHEFGHNFDGIAVSPQYNFGAGASVEALANIKLIYMMDILDIDIDLGGRIYTSTQNFLDLFYTPLYSQYFSSNELNFYTVMETDPSTGLRATYSSIVGPMADYNMMVLQKKAEKVGVSKFFETLTFYNQHTPVSLWSTDTNYIRRIPENQIRNRMEQFVYFFSSISKTDLSMDFINDKYPVGTATRQKITTFLSLPAYKQTAQNMIRIDHGLAAQ